MKIGLNKEKSIIIATKLNKYLADLHVLYSKLHNYHWNVVGIGFFEMHLKLEEFCNRNRYCCRKNFTTWRKTFSFYEILFRSIYFERSRKRKN